MKLGAEPKQIGILVGLLCLALYLYWSNLPDTPAPQAGRTARPADVASNRPQPVSVKKSTTKRDSAKSTLQDFKPSLKPRKEGIDPATVDPSLNLELLAKVQRVNLAGGTRSLFDFGAAPVPKAPTPPPIIVKPPMASDIAKTLTPAPTGPPPAAPKTPIPLKFYGFMGGSRQASKRAFFLEGEEIHVAGEGDLIRKRFKVVRIGLTSAVVQDTMQNYEQTLPLEEPQQAL